MQLKQTRVALCVFYKETEKKFSWAANHDIEIERYIKTSSTDIERCANENSKILMEIVPDSLLDYCSWNLNSWPKIVLDSSRVMIYCITD